MLTIRKAYLPKGHRNRPGYSMKANGLLYHTTNNWDSRADDVMHGKYMLTTDRTVSWHNTVDSDSMTRHIKQNENAWHAGDGGNGYYNRNWIGLEITCNHVKPGEKLDKETYDNAVQAAAFIMQEEGFNSMEQLAPHNVVYGKDCPHHTLFDRGEFERDVIAVLHGKQAVRLEKPEVGSVIITNPEMNVEKRDGDLIRFGDRGTDVRYVQSRLNYHGENLSIDSIFGSQTIAAVRNFQRKKGLSVDGIVGPKTIKELKKAKPSNSKSIRPYPGYLIKLTSPYMRDKGSDIEAVQRAIDVKSDGIYGPMSARAVKEYQMSHGLSVDGIFGPSTWNTLF